MQTRNTSRTPPSKRSLPETSEKDECEKETMSLKGVKRIQVAAPVNVIAVNLIEDTESDHDDDSKTEAIENQTQNILTDEFIMV